MANLSSVQEQLRVIKTGTESEKKNSLTPDSIADVRVFIREERANRPQTNASLEWDFREWEDLIAKYDAARWQITVATATATANTAHGVNVSTERPRVVVAPPMASQGDGAIEIRESLTTLDPQSLEQAAQISERIIRMMPPWSQENLRAIHSAVIYDVLRNAGYNLVLRNGQIEIIPKSWVSVVNLSEKLQSLVNTGALSLNSLKVGMLYASPSFQDYAGLHKRKDASGRELIDPKASMSDFIQYLQDKKNAGEVSPDVMNISQSASMLQGVNMQEAIRNYRDIGLANTWVENNPKVVELIAWTLRNSAEIKSPTSLQDSPSQKSAEQITVLPETNTTITGKLTRDGVTGWNITGAVKDSSQWLVQGIGDILSLGKWDPIAQLGIGAALIYGVYKAFQKFWFLGGVATLFGVGAMNNIDKILWRFGVGSVSEGIDKAGKNIGEVTDNIKNRVSGEPEKEEAKKNEEKKENNGTITKTKETPLEGEAQKIASDPIRQSPEFQKQLDPERIKNSRYKANMEEYLKYINQNLKDTPINTIIAPKDKKNGIFYDGPSLEQNIPENMDPTIFKTMMRMYFTGQYITSSKLSTNEFDKLITEKIRKAWNNPRLSEAIFNIQK